MITNILTAEAEHANFNVHSQADYERAQLEMLRLAGRRRVHVAQHEEPAPLVARVDYGRWIGDCHNCRAGVALHPRWTIGLCFGCGARYASVIFPENITEIEAALLARPRQENRNWVPGESVDDLLRDNVENL